MSSILRKYCSELSKVIAHPNVVATALYSKELITRGEDFVVIIELYFAGMVNLQLGYETA